MYIVSACLCGVNCKYSGKNNLNEDCMRLLKCNKALLVCPEQLGGLTTPRKPSEIVKDGDTIKVVNTDNEDVTNEFIKGAKEVLNIARVSNIKKAILKEGSPSCGCNFIYDGTFTGKKIKGEGLTCKILRESGIEVISDEEYSKNNK
ncbi:MAG: DUF523 domain-containing protein [Clostridium sp.]|nr:DUF523 domain-containing protein [Clostridium sp.]